MTLIKGILFSVFVVGMFVGLPLWCFYRFWLPWTGDIVDRAVHGEKEETDLTK